MIADIQITYGEIGLILFSIIIYFIILFLVRRIACITSDKADKYILKKTRKGGQR